MFIHESLKNMLREFANLEEVESILIAGSRTTDTVDLNSDYDVYIYAKDPIPVSQREAITSKYCSYKEINNQFWETEDDVCLIEENIPVDLVYRSLQWLDASLHRTLIMHEADIGYTTCFWANLLNSYIFFDREGLAKALQEKYSIPFPEKLKANIIKKNYCLLKENLPAYYFQIEKALKREDYISVNHRVAAFLASYFDIIFAINEMPHPGEKKILKILESKAHKLPKDMSKNIKNILSYCADNSNKLLKELDELIENLNQCLIVK